ncbi:MAG: DUF6268 family outer membrane beta-barrel protein [Planctomycetota bacterium]|nr:DUF6268 family outer membrane beta-barrel protein [Planctomycetota bacterium]
MNTARSFLRRPSQLMLAIAGMLLGSVCGLVQAQASEPSQTDRGPSDGGQADSGAAGNQAGTPAGGQTPSATRAPTPAPRPQSAEVTAAPVGARRPLAPGELPPVRATLFGGFEYVFDSDVQGRTGSVSASRADLGLNITFPVNATSQLSLDFTNVAVWYEFDPLPLNTQQNSEFPLEEAFEHGVTLRFSQQVDETWSYFVGGDVNVAGERGASWDDAITAGAIGGVRAQLSPTFSLGFGAIVRTRLEDEALVFPALTFDWQLAEQWRLSSRGRGVSLTYSPTETWSFFVDGVFNSSDYRLDDDVDDPFAGGVVRDRRFNVAVGTTWRASSRFLLTARVGSQVWQEFELLDSSGNGVTDFEVEPALYLALGVELKF